MVVRFVRMSDGQIQVQFLTSESVVMGTASISAVMFWDLLEHGKELRIQYVIEE